MSDEAFTPLRFDLSLSQRLEVAWNGALGPAHASFAHVGALEPEQSTYLGTGARHGRVSVLPGPAVAYLDGDSAHARLPDGTVLTLPGVRKPALVQARTTWLAGVAADGVLLVGAPPFRKGRLSNDGRAPNDALEPRTISKRPMVRELRAVAVHDALLLLAILDGGLLVVFHDPSTKETREVVHRLGGKLVNLACLAKAGRTAVALAFEDGGVEFALFNASGAAIERPHRVWEPRGDFDSLSVLWDRTRFVVALRTKADRTLRFAGDTMSPLPDVSMPVRLMYLSRCLYAFGVVEMTGTGEANLMTITREEGLVARLPPRPIEPAERVIRSHQLAVRRRLIEVQRVGQGAYRSAERLRVEGQRCELRHEGVVVELELDVSAEAAGAMNITARLRRYEPDASLPPPSGALIRLAAWVRRGFGSDPRAEEDARWAEARLELAGQFWLASPSRLKATRSGSAATIRFELSELPPASTIAAWLRALR
ncbi:MAG: hypothetical protein AAF938_29420 [Myxococcota bacterium]